MRAMLLDHPHSQLRLGELTRRTLEPGQLRLRVKACGVCRTDLHIADGDLPELRSPVVPGHEIVGIVAEVGAGVAHFRIGDRVGVPWLGWTCGHCVYCTTGRENLCATARFTGYHLDGGYADAAAAPLLCAGLIGYRALVHAGDARRLGIYGFGAAAHIVAQVARWQGRELFAFTRPGDRDAQAFAKSLGAVWAGDSSQTPPEPLDAAILFAPVGELVPAALRAVAPGGTVVCAGIHMSDIPAFPYAILWGERTIRSVANLTRRDCEEFLAIAPQVPVRTEVETFALEQANEALARLREGRITGAAVVVP
jgi:propanol-preferring alcohol dehydrogenase